MAETLLGIMAAVLGLGALAFTLTHRTAQCYWAWYVYPSGASIPVSGLAAPAISAPAILLGTGALLVVLGALGDVRVRVARHRTLLVVMMAVGALYSSLATFLVYAGHMWIAVGRSPSNGAQCSIMAPHAGQVSLVLVYSPVTVVCAVCVIVALARNESRRPSVS